MMNPTTDRTAVSAALLLCLPFSALADPPAGYYDSVDATNSTTLRTTLHAVIDDHERFPYTSGATDTWDILNLADEDRNNSGNILDVYRNASYPKISGGIRDYNREHTWPKSKGVPDNSVNATDIDRDCAEPPTAGAVLIIQDDPDARQLYRRMIDSLRAARTLSFESEYRLDLGDLPGARARCKVWLKKPNYFRLEASQVGGEGSGVLIGDGRQLWIYWPKSRPVWGDEDPATASRSEVYMTKPTPIAGHSIGHEVAYLGAGILMNILDLSTFHGYTDSLQTYIDAVAGRGTERIGEEECDVIEVSIMDGQRTWKIWLSRRDHLPRRLLETVRVYEDIVAEERWKNVVVDAEMPDTLFDWRPPENWKEWRKPEAEENILRQGTLAPDFELRLSDGKMVKLSQFRGKVVWLFLWRVG